MAEDFDGLGVSSVDIDKRQMTIVEYIFKNLETMLYGFRNALGVWGALVTVIFLKLTPKGYTDLASAMMVLAIFQIPYGFVAARIADKIKKHKRAIAFMHIPVVVTLLLAAVPIAIWFPNIGDTPKIIYIFFANFINTLIGSISQNCWNILDARLTPSSKDRTFIWICTNVLNGIGSLSALVTPIVIFLFKGFVDSNLAENDANALYYFYGMVFFSILLIPVNYIWLYVRKVRIPAPPLDVPTDVKSTFKGMLKNKPLWLKKISQIICEWGGISGVAFTVIVSRYYYGLSYEFIGINYRPDVPMLFMIFSFTITIPAFISMLLIPKIRKRFSDKAIYIFSALFVAGVNLVLFILVSGYFLQISLEVRYVIHMICYGACGFVNGFSVCGAVMDLELLDYTEWQTGQRNESTYNFVLGNIFRPITIPIIYVSAVLLVRTGYQTDVSEGVLDFEIVKRLFALSALPGIIFNVLGMIPMFFYNFSGQKRQRIMDELAIRRQNVIEGKNPLYKRNMSNVEHALIDDFNIY